MTEPEDTTVPMDPVDPGSDEALSAYLAGELDAVAEAAFEARLAAEPDLAAQLDALAGALVVLADADGVEPPDGFADRLGARLDAEAAAADLDARRRASQRRWGAVASAAAAVAVLAIAGGSLLPRSGDDSAQIARHEESAGSAESLTLEQAPPGEGAHDMAGLTQDSVDIPHGSAADSPYDSAGTALSDPDAYTADESAQAPKDGADSSQGYREDSGTAGGSGGGGGMADSPASASAPEERGATRRGGAVVADEGAAFASDDDLRAYYQGRPEAENLRGMPRDQALEVAARHADEVRAAGPFRSGVRPDACLDEVLQMDQGPRIVARAEWARWQGGDSLVYLLATAGPQSDAIDRYELWVVQPDGCSLRRHLSWR